MSRQIVFSVGFASIRPANCKRFQESSSRYVVELLVWRGAARPRRNSDSSYASTDPEDSTGESETDEANLDWVRRTLKNDFE